MKTYADVLASQHARQQQIAKEQQARRSELEYFAQLEADRRTRRAEDHARQLIMPRVIAAGRAAVARGEPLPKIPGWDEVYPSREQMQAEREKAEAERVAAIPPHDKWLLTLPWAERQRVLTYEKINGEEWPR